MARVQDEDPLIGEASIDESPLLADQAGHQGLEGGDGDGASPPTDSGAKAPTARDLLNGLLYLALGIVVARGSWVFIKSTDTALLGHVSDDALSAASLSDLWTMSTAVILNGGVLSVFVGNAVGVGNQDLACAWFQVSVAVIGTLTLPVVILWVFGTYPVVSLMEDDKNLVSDATYYAASLAASLPAKTLMGQVSQFLSGNSRVGPEAAVSTFASVVNLLVGLALVLGEPSAWFGGKDSAIGFKACPWVTVGTEYIQFIFLWLFFIRRQRVFESLGWKGWNMREAVTRVRVIEFLRLYIPSMLSSASDFWRMALIGVFAAQIGKDEVAVFNASYRILWISLTFVGSLAMGLRIQLSSMVANGDTKGAWLAIKVGTILVMVALSITALVVLVFIHQVASIFTNDPKLLDLFVDCRWPLALTLITMNLTVFLEQIPVALGLTRAVFFVGVLGSWAGQVPAAYLFINYWRHDLVGLYTGVATGYLITSVTLAVVIVRIDWKSAIADAQRRGDM